MRRKSNEYARERRTGLYKTECKFSPSLIAAALSRQEGTYSGFCSKSTQVSWPVAPLQFVGCQTRRLLFGLFTRGITCSALIGWRCSCDWQPGTLYCTAHQGYNSRVIEFVKAASETSRGLTCRFQTSLGHLACVLRCQSDTLTVLGRRTRHPAQISNARLTKGSAKRGLNPRHGLYETPHGEPR